MDGIELGFSPMLPILAGASCLEFVLVRFEPASEEAVIFTWATRNLPHHVRPVFVFPHHPSEIKPCGRFSGQWQATTQRGLFRLRLDCLPAELILLIGNRLPTRVADRFSLDVPQLDEQKWRCRDWYQKHSGSNIHQCRPMHLLPAFWARQR